MQQEYRFATFNVCNLALPGAHFYDGLEPYTAAEYEAKISWIAQQIDILDADVIGFQEIFSQAALKDVLARTQEYRNAHHAGFDPDPQADRYTPSVALVSRFPFDRIANDVELPDKVSPLLPGAAGIINRFTRPVLQARVRLSNSLAVNVFVVHLKSKRPDYGNGENAADSTDSSQADMAVLRSLIRRGAEALGLRYLVIDQLREDRSPLLVMGDFNDVAASVTTQIVMGTRVPDENELDDRLFDSYRIRSHRDRVPDADYTQMHEGGCETIDHILVSEAFDTASRGAIGEVLDVTYLNRHLSMEQTEASDHGIVLARIRILGR